jgi:RNA polymerase sigma-54 factor
MFFACSNIGMIMKLSVGLKVANNLSLTPQLQQAIRLLQLSSLELEQEIQIQLDSNPLLEKIEDNNSIESLNSVEANENKDLTSELNADHLPNDLPVDTEWDDIYTHQSTALATPEYEEREDNRQIHLSLKEHILEQVNLLHFSRVDKLIAYCIVDSLDDKGFLDADLTDILIAVNQLLREVDNDEDVEEDEVIVVLKHIQRLEPIGVGSRSLAECLQIQLETIKDKTPFLAEAKQLLNYYELLISNDLNKLLKQTGLSKEQLTNAIELLKP